MNHPKASSTRFRSSLLLFLFTVASIRVAADPVPQFAFNIGSNQIPAGIWPVAVASDAFNKIYISSLWNMIKLNKNGELINQWGTQGTGPAQFSYSGQMAFDQAGHLYVADIYNDRIEEFDTDGRFIIAWGAHGSRPGQFDGIYGLAVSRSGLIYVSDMNNFRVQVFSGPGVFLKQFGTIGTDAGQFSFPGVLTVDSSNNVYVTDAPGGDFFNFRVQKFDADGNFLSQWGAYGSNTADSIEVAGIASDPQNNIYVVDSANNRIQKFSSDGTFLSQWGSLGTKSGLLNGPMGIAIDPSGNYVYVADYYNARISVFAYSPLEPLIYAPPTNQVVPAGMSLILNAGVFGAQPLAYQWSFNGADLTGATSASLVVSNISLSASGIYSVSASNSLGSAGSPSATITVLPAVITSLPASGISATGAVLNGSIRVGGYPSFVWFEWGTNTNYGSIIGTTNVGSNARLDLSVHLQGLIGQVEYHYRLVGSNNLGIVYGNDISFQIGLKPSVVTLPPVPENAGSVFLTASVNPESRNTAVFFRWGRANAYEHYTSTNQLASLATPLTVRNQVTGLVSGFTYTAQAVASNDMGTVAGAIVSFVAPPWVLLPVPSGNVWSSLAISADGNSLAAVAPGSQIYLSSDSGMTWTNNPSQSEPWQALAMSADASHLVIAAGGALASGPVYFSTNSGKSWTKSRSPDRTWYALASSANGLQLAAVDAPGQHVLTSTNGGLDWQTNSPPIAASWSSIACSADGRRLIVAAGGVDRATNGPVFTSLDAGRSWTSNNLPVSYWRSVASSADGQTLLAAVGGLHSGSIYFSTNGGTAWVPTSAPVTNWQRVALSADGKTFAGLVRVSANQVYTSTDLGSSWKSHILPQAIWSDLALSADGAKLFVSGDQDIVMLNKPSQPELKAGASGFLWVIPSTQFVLQQNSDLINGRWTNSAVVPAIVFSNLSLQVSLPIGSADGFYRLKRAE